jgi:aryl-alcohol dehydrogenase-like predicted oxidoreductase
MRYRPLGRSGLIVSEVGFGCLPIAGGFYGPANDATSRAAVARALELGCTFFDAADVYGGGRSERLLGEAVRARRAEVVIATKAGLGSPDGHRPKKLAEALASSLERLGVSCVDLFQLHDPPLPVLADPAVQDLLGRLRSDRKARAVGVSVVSVADGLAALDHGVYDAVQIEVNLLAPEATFEFLPRAAKKRVGVIVKVPLDHGFLSGRYGPDSAFGPEDLRAHAPREEILWRSRALEELRVLWRDGSGRTAAQAALRYLLDLPGVSTVIPGIKTPGQAEESMAASSVPPLSDQEKDHVQRAQRRVWR